MNDLDMLLPERASSEGWRWGTVRSVTPLRVQLDGDTASLFVTPDALAPVRIGQRVWVQLNGARVILHPRETATPGIVRWQKPTLVNSWVNYAAEYHRAGYLKTTAGIVVLTGIVRSGTMNTTIFTLPVGYRPDGILAFAVAGSGPHSDFYVYPDGRVVVGAQGTNGYISLDGVMFPAAGAVTWQTIVPGWIGANWSPYGLGTWPQPSVGEDSLGRMWNKGLWQRAGAPTLAASELVYNAPIQTSYIQHYATVGGGGGYSTSLITPGAGITAVQAHVGTGTGSVSFNAVVHVNANKRPATDWSNIEIATNSWVPYNAADTWPFAKYMEFDDGIILFDGLIGSGTVGAVQSYMAPQDAFPDIGPVPGKYGAGQMIFPVAANLAAARTDIRYWLPGGATPSFQEISGSAVWRSYANIRYMSRTMGF